MRFSVQFSSEKVNRNHMPLRFRVLLFKYTTKHTYTPSLEQGLPSGVSAYSFSNPNPEVRARRERRGPALPEETLGDPPRRSLSFPFLSFRVRMRTCLGITCRLPTDVLALISDISAAGRFHVYLSKRVKVNAISIVAFGKTKI